MTQQQPEPASSLLPLAGKPSRVGALGTAVCVMAYAWTATTWLSVGASLWSAVVYALLGVLSGLISLAAGVLALIWLWRARRNADLIAPDQQRWSSLWVWLGWIVPGFSYFIPKQVIDDVWRSTVPGAEEPETGWWWGTWIVLSLTSLVGGFFAGEFTGVDLTIYDLIIAVETTFVLIFWIRVVRIISYAQDALPDPSLRLSS